MICSHTNDLARGRSGQRKKEGASEKGEETVTKGERREMGERAYHVYSSWPLAIAR
jgi:hypothetical protein